MAAKSNKVHIFFFQNIRSGYTPDTLTTILAEAHYTVNGKRKKMRFSTGLKCRIRHLKNDRVYHTAQNATNINSRLDAIRRNAEPAYLQAIESGKFPTRDKFKEMILKGTFEVNLEREMLADLDLYIEYLKSNNAHRGTLSNVATLKGHLIEFRRRTKYVLDYETINLDFYGKFRHYLESVNGTAGKYSLNTVGNFIKKLKMFLNWAKVNGWNPHEYYKHPQFKIPEMRVKNIYLEESEINALLGLDLKNKPGLARTRDWFVLATQTGMRYGDYSQFCAENIVEVQGGYDFIYVPRKTRKQTKGASVRVPLSNLAVRIAARHAFNLPKPSSNQKVNDALKKLVVMAGINKEVSSHDARRTFATLAYKVWELDLYLIMQITGHRTQKEFLKYLCIEGEENAQLIRAQNERFRVDRPGLLDSKLKVV